jgi:flagellar basal-body rod protein FlgC
MDYFNAFAISASGMTVEKTRLDVIAVNLANMNSTHKADGTPFRPLQVASAQAGPSFAAGFERMGGGAALRGARVTAVTEMASGTRVVYEPGNPEADSKGFVTLPAVDHLTQMANMSNALRAYQANVLAMNAAKAMAAKALEIGAQ